MKQNPRSAWALAISVIRATIRDFKPETRALLLEHVATIADDTPGAIVRDGPTVRELRERLFRSPDVTLEQLDGELAIERERRRRADARGKR